MSALVLHSDLGTCGLHPSPSPPSPPPPDVISPSGHAVVHPGQCFQMRQTERRSPVPAAVALSQTAEYTQDELSTKKTRQYSIRETDY